MVLVDELIFLSMFLVKWIVIQVFGVSCCIKSFRLF